MEYDIEKAKQNAIDILSKKQEAIIAAVKHGTYLGTSFTHKYCDRDIKLNQQLNLAEFNACCVEVDTKGFDRTAFDHIQRLYGWSDEMLNVAAAFNKRGRLIDRLYAGEDPRQILLEVVSS